MEEFEQSCDPWNWEWKSSSQVRSLESEMEEFERNSVAWNREWNSSSQVPRGMFEGWVHDTDTCKGPEFLSSIGR